MVSNAALSRRFRRAALYRHVSQATRDKPFRLLDLPVEIRGMILKELLWQPEPIFFGPQHEPRGSPDALQRSPDLDSDDSDMRDDDITETESDMGFDSHMQRESDMESDMDSDMDYDSPAGYLGYNSGHGPYILNRQQMNAVNYMRPKTLFPEVLRVCKQLRDEGQPFWHDNAVKCIIGYDHPAFGPVRPITRPILVTPKYHLCCGSACNSRNHRATSSALPLGLRTSMRRMHIEVVVEYQMRFLAYGQHDNDDIAPYVWQAVKECAKFLKEHVNYQHLSFDLRVTRRPTTCHGTMYHELSERYAKFCELVQKELLQPFTYIRKRSHISVQGVDGGLAKRLQLIATEEPILDLDALYSLVKEYGTSLLESMNSVGPHGTNCYGTQITAKTGIECALHTCKTASQTGNAEEFLRARSELLEAGAELQLIRAEGVLRLDDDALVPPRLQHRYLRPAGQLARVVGYTTDRATSP